LGIVEIARGNVVLMVVPSDLGRPLPGIVVQADELTADLSTLLICPVSSDLQGRLLLRPVIEPAPENGLRLPLREAFTAATGRFASQGIAVADASEALAAFFADRLKVQQREAGVRHDLIDAVFSLGDEDDLVRLLARVRALQAFIASADGGDLLTGYKRAANILRKENWNAVDGAAAAPSYALEPQEAALIAALDAAGPKARSAVENEDFEDAMAALASLRAPVDAFFDHVTVNDADPLKREARLTLLARIRDAVHGVADFSRIEG